jgi:hypothetical protein
MGRVSTGTDVLVCKACYLKAGAKHMELHNVFGYVDVCPEVGIGRQMASDGRRSGLTA